MDLTEQLEGDEVQYAESDDQSTTPPAQEKEEKSEGVTTRRIPAVYSNPSIAGYLRPWRFLPAERSGTSKITYAKTSRFQIRLDVEQMTKVHVDSTDSAIIVEGWETPVEDKLGMVSRWMKRTYKVPPDIQLDTLQSTEQKAAVVITAKRNLKDSLGENYFKIFPTVPPSTEAPRSSLEDHENSASTSVENIEGK